MRTLKAIIITTLIIGISSLAYCAESARTAVLAKMDGQVEVKQGSGGWSAAQPGMVLKQGDAIKTATGASAIIDVDVNNQSASVDMKQKSELKIAELIGAKESDTQKTLLDLAMGEIMIKTKKLNTEKSNFEVKTPTSIVGVRGTTFSVSVEAVE